MPSNLLRARCPVRVQRRVLCAMFLLFVVPGALAEVMRVAIANRADVALAVTSRSPAARERN